MGFEFPHVMAVAVTCLCLAIGLAGLLAYLWIMDKSAAGGFAVKAGRNQINGTEGGMLLAVIVVLLIGAAAFWPKPTLAADQATAQSAATSSSATPAPVPTGPGPEPSKASVTLSAQTPTRTPAAVNPTGASAQQDQAFAFVKSYLAAMVAPNRSEADLTNWFTFPVEFYGLRDVTDKAFLFEKLTPNTSVNRTVYGPPSPVGFVSSTELITLFVRIDYQRASGERGSTRVKYDLIPSSSGQPYRIRSITETLI